ncbi:hypothetical protein Emag_005243 [Eimeria magna]
MTAGWRPEDGVRLLPLLRHNASTVKAVGSLETEGSSGSTSVGVNKLLLLHRHAHRAPAGTTVLALVLAALALTYLMVTCMRHLSKRYTVSSQQWRLLAGNSTDENEEACQEPPGDGEQETEAENAEGPAAEGAAAAPVPADSGAHDPALAAPAGTTRRLLPPHSHVLVGRTVLLLEQPATFLMSFISILSPDLSLAIVRNLCRIVALELSAFATVPPSLQPLRQRVAKAYVNLIEHVLTKEPMAGVAVQKGWATHLRLVQVLLERLGGVPGETEILPAGDYVNIMEIQQRVSHWMYSQVLSVLQTIKQVKIADRTRRSDETLLFLNNILTSLFTVRRIQVLHNTTLRHWLEVHHRSSLNRLIFNPAILAQARVTRIRGIYKRINAITAAVLHAGGQPTSQYAPLPLTPEEQQQVQQGQTSLTHFIHHQHPKPPSPRPPQAYRPAPVPSATPPAKHAHPIVQPVLHAPHTPQPPQPAQVDAQETVHFDAAAQDSQFPALNPNPRIGGQQSLPPTPTLQIHLPSIYQYSHLLPLDEP